MKSLPIILAVILIAVIGFHISNTLSSYDMLRNLSFVEGETKAYDPTNESVPGYEQTQKRISGMMKVFRESEKKFSTTDLVLNLMVTIFTAAAALITSISTIKTAAVSKTAAILIAVIAFVSSILSFSQSQVGKLKEEVVKQNVTLVAIRNELEALKPSKLPAQLPRINRRLDDEF